MQQAARPARVLAQATPHSPSAATVSGQPMPPWAELRRASPQPCPRHRWVCSSTASNGQSWQLCSSGAQAVASVLLHPLGLSGMEAMGTAQQCPFQVCSQANTTPKPSPRLLSSYGNSTGHLCPKHRNRDVGSGTSPGPGLSMASVYRQCQAAHKGVAPRLQVPWICGPCSRLNDLCPLLHAYSPHAGNDTHTQTQTSTCVCCPVPTSSS